VAVAVRKRAKSAGWSGAATRAAEGGWGGDRAQQCGSAQDQRRVDGADVADEAGGQVVVGVIGGYKQRGDSPGVSYAAALKAAAGLYQNAEANG